MNDRDALIRSMMNNPAEDTPRLMLSDYLRENGEGVLADRVAPPLVVKKFGIDFDSDGGALTLDGLDVCNTGAESGTHTRTHEDGWTITGVIHEDYYVWVNYFEASHPVYGFVWGDFESEVFSTGEDTFFDFYGNHHPQAWDYHDI